MLLHAILTFRRFVGLTDAISEMNHNTYMITENTKTNTVDPMVHCHECNKTSFPAFPVSQKVFLHCQICHLMHAFYAAHCPS